ncbi:hypothetical protein HZH66_005690 [Vespula vulgaris]|uniref:Uncharacterized protein n=1 Tax=Vespula vulgaris TaxID=7454 RepID=A0A834K5M9_VESVU|nr:hypothetical protein HZH66_005690 [Vespula vulgaris]
MPKGENVYTGFENFKWWLNGKGGERVGEGDDVAGREGNEGTKDERTGNLRWLLRNCATIQVLSTTALKVALFLMAKNTVQFENSSKEIEDKWKKLKCS